MALCPKSHKHNSVLIQQHVAKLYIPMTDTPTTYGLQPLLCSNKQVIAEVISACDCITCPTCNNCSIPSEMHLTKTMQRWND